MYTDDSLTLCGMQPIIYESFCNDINAGSIETSLPTVNNPVEDNSIFGDVDCGEPLKPQHLIINFTPDKSIDTPESQKKCCEFWDYINSRDDIQDLIALPDPNVDINISSDDTSATSKETVTVPVPKKKTAISMLEICEQKDMVKPAFEPKLCFAKCPIGFGDYFGDEHLTKGAPKKTVNVCKCKGPCRNCPAPKTPIIHSSPDVVAMCKHLKDWNDSHPKSMDPPGPPLEHHPILQRSCHPPA